MDTQGINHVGIRVRDLAATRSLPGSVIELDGHATAQFPLPPTTTRRKPCPTYC